MMYIGIDARSSMGMVLHARRKPDVKWNATQLSEGVKTRAEHGATRG